ncbi:hypothetical protein [Streptosporangium sp. NPDC049376]|uniref:hypothetical protein n=1 Tax=Streptosporangium sp. NPDC049376 TaxID=3366192 RepID=UPI0037BA1C8B
MVKAMRNAHLRTYADRREEPPSDADLMRESFSIDVPGELVVGHRKDRTGVDIQAAGLSLGLTGPRADDAIRVIVLDLLRQADRFRVEVILSAPDGQRLFAVSAEELKAVPGLIVTGTSDAAVDRRLRGHRASRCPLRQGTRPDVPHRLQPGERRPVGLSERDQRSPYRRRQGGTSHRSQLCRGVLAEGLTCEWIDERRSPQTRIQADVLNHSPNSRNGTIRKPLSTSSNGSSSSTRTRRRPGGASSASNSA